MVKDHVAEVIGKQVLSPDAFRLDLHAPGLAEALRPGQFVQVLLPSQGFDPLLRRPLGYLRRDETRGTVQLLVRIRGRGTALLRSVRQGDQLGILGPLGRGFTTGGEGPLLMIAGGVGLVPIFDLAATLAGMTSVTVVYGARSAVDLYEIEALRTMPVELLLTTDDGSVGRRGTVMAALAELDAGGGLSRYRRFYACGPKPMLAAVQALMEARDIPGEFSLEERMACGFGACLGCVVPIGTADGGVAYRRVCTEGPVFFASEVIFRD